MLKLSVTLPNDLLITLESDGAEPVHEVLALILNSMKLDNRPPKDNHVGPEIATERAAEKGNGVADSGSEAGIPEASNGFHRERMPGVIPSPSYGVASGNGWYGNGPVEGGDSILDLSRYPSQARQDFVAFCHAVNPTGDMRRVVVATEAADRFFGLEGVTADEVGELFDLIGWRRANNFTQTIRNAARSKFGWLERIPGRAGRYAATDVGRSTTLAG